MRALLQTTLALSILAPPLSVAQVVPFDSNRWEISGETAVRMEYNGKKALYLYDGRAVLDDDRIEDGVIEFDIAFSAERGFSGLFWRMDSEHREEFYFRPHLSGKPDANQYNPVLHGVSGWQLYFGPSYSAPIRYRFNEWMHVRVVFSGSLADIYVDSSEPVLSVQLKSPPAPGRVGVFASSFAPAYFADFEYRPLEGDMPSGDPIPEAAAPPGALMDWLVSNSFDNENLEGTSDLEPSVFESRSWTTVRAEPTGIVNLARYAVPERDRSTVLAKTTLRSETESLRVLRFGYSDRASVYLNGKLLYRGSNEYRSRDYRYLGTIGLFDAVPLRLRAGDNDLVVAVSESFGGWGLMASVE